MVEKHISTVPIPRNGHMKREQILEAAHRHFSHYGFSKVTMNDIAAELGMGKASLYYYFPTKEELFQAVLTAKHEDFLNEIYTVTNTKLSSAKKIRTYVEMRMNYFCEVLNLNLVDFQYWQSIRPHLKTTFRKLAQKEQQMLRQIMTEGVRAGEFNIRSTEKTAHALLQIMRGIRCQFIRAIEGPQVQIAELQSLKREMLFVADIFIRGITESVEKKKIDRETNYHPLQRRS